MTGFSISSEASAHATPSCCNILTKVSFAISSSFLTLSPWILVSPVVPRMLSRPADRRSRARDFPARPMEEKRAVRALAPADEAAGFARRNCSRVRGCCVIEGQGLYESNETLLVRMGLRCQRVTNDQIISAIIAGLDGSGNETPVPYLGPPEEGNPLIRSATMEPMITLAFMRTGIRRSSMVNQTRMFPLLRNRP